MLYRSLLKNPDIMLFDEFTQSLDLPSKKEIESISTLKNELNKTIIWVSHDLDEIMRICNKVLYIKNGEIKETVELNNSKLNNRVFPKFNHLMNKQNFIWSNFFKRFKNCL